MKRFTAIIDEIHPDDAWYDVKDRLIGKTCTSFSDVELNNTGDLKGYYNGSFTVDDVCSVIVFFAVKLSNIQPLEE